MMMSSLLSGRRVVSANFRLPASVPRQARQLSKIAKDDDNVHEGMHESMAVVSNASWTLASKTTQVQLWLPILLPLLV